MIPIKIDCDCGQPYSFEVEPVDGRMPSPVACPSCGADGTMAANEFISTQLISVDAVVEPAAQPVQLSRAIAPSAGAQETGLRRGVVNRPQAERQAKLKTMAGESQEQVSSYLLMQGFTRSDAMELAYRLSTERVAIVRSNGIKKIIVGAVLICLPFIAYDVFKALGFILVRRFILSIVAGIAGAYMCISGIIMVVSPKSEKGNVVKE